jgi:peptide-methionine (R)-S-oxide reductase
MQDMIKILKTSGILMLAFLFQECYSQTSNKNKIASMDASKTGSDTSGVNRTDAEWKKTLPSDVYYVARQKGTERPYSSKYETSKEIGTYYCAVCGNALFKSDTKFDSGCGWPSFYEPISKTSIIYAKDDTYGMERTEVMCGKCKSHLGHVFNDGPPPTGLRFCINGVVLDFHKAQEAQKKYDEKKS